MQNQILSNVADIYFVVTKNWQFLAPDTKGQSNYQKKKVNIAFYTDMLSNEWLFMMPECVIHSITSNGTSNIG